VQGRSLRPLLAGEAEALRDWAYVEYDTTELGDRLRHVRSKEWALTYYTESEQGVLFDLRNDPDELYNRWDDPGCASAKNEVLHALLRETARADDWLPPRKATA
jgi:arylsulfatase